MQKYYRMLTKKVMALVICREWESGRNGVETKGKENGVVGIRR
jgi:hypothetical protein